jgi:hypothetical protein
VVLEEWLGGRESRSVHGSRAVAVVSESRSVRSTSAVVVG